MKHTDICFQSVSRVQFLASTNPLVQISFLKQNRNMFTRKICKARKVLISVARAFCFQLLNVKIHKMSGVFSAKLYCKCAIFFASFCWLRDVLLENLKF